MTEPADGVVPGVLARISRASGHELRNALNGLAVNLEAARSGVAEPDARHFIEHAIEHAEESIRLAEASITLLNLITEALDSSGRLRGSQDVDRVAIDGNANETERRLRALRPLADKRLVSVGASGSSVILTIHETNAG